MAYIVLYLDQGLEVLPKKVLLLKKKYFQSEVLPTRSEIIHHNEEVLLVGSEMNHFRKEVLPTGSFIFHHHEEVLPTGSEMIHF